MNELNEKILRKILRYGGIDGGQHKQWLIDQITRILCDCPKVDMTRKLANGDIITFKVYGTSERYKQFLKDYSGNPNDEDNYYGEWDEGIAP